jgi:hypothetical protein
VWLNFFESSSINADFYVFLKPEAEGICMQSSLLTPFALMLLPIAFCHSTSSSTVTPTFFGSLCVDVEAVKAQDFTTLIRNGGDLDKEIDKVS